MTIRYDLDKILTALDSSLTETLPLWNDLWNSLTPTVSKLPCKLLSGTFPPCNYYAEKDGTLHFQFAVAGYTESEIDLKFADDHMVLKLTPTNAEKDNEDEFKWFQKGIKYTSGETKVFVPFSKYDVDNTEVVLKDGMLTVSVKMKDEAKPVSVKIKKL